MSPVLPTANATRSAAVYRPIVDVTLTKLGAASLELSGITATYMPESVTPTMYEYSALAPPCTQ